MKKVKIYTLSHPITKEIRYVGKTNYELQQRLSKHLITNENNHRSKWIKKLLKSNLKPIIELIEEVNEDVWVISEIYWIAQFKAWGFRLVNATEGGECGVISPQCREACIKTNKNKKGYKRDWSPSKELRAQISEKLKGRKLSIETLEKRSKTTTGRKLSQINKDKIGESNSLQVDQFDLNSKYIQTFKSMTDAALKTNSSISKISLCCNNKRNKHNKFKWEFKNE